MSKLLYTLVLMSGMSWAQAPENVLLVRSLPSGKIAAEVKSDFCDNKAKPVGVLKGFQVKCLATTEDKEKVLFFTIFQNTSQVVTLKTFPLKPNKLRNTAILNYNSEPIEISF